MIRSAFYANPQTDKAKYDLSPEEMRRVLKKEEALLWVILDMPTSDELDILKSVFHFHPLTIEDSEKDDGQPPKIDDFGNYVFIITRSIHADKNLTQMDAHELNIFLGANYLVTVTHVEEPLAINAVFDRLQRDERLSSFGADYLCHAVLDALVDAYTPVIDQMDEEIEKLEDKVLSRPHPKTMARILDLKHAIMELRRTVSPMREVMNRLSRDEFAVIDAQSRIYFRDVYDHLVRMLDLTDSIRDIVSGTMDIYLNSTSLRLNEVMRALTVVSTIFLPITFLAGVYGMNFTHMFPTYDWKYGFAVFCLVCVLVAVGMLAWFRRKGWF